MCVRVYFFLCPTRTHSLSRSHLAKTCRVVEEKRSPMMEAPVAIGRPLASSQAVPAHVVGVDTSQSQQTSKSDNHLRFVQRTWSPSAPPEPQQRIETCPTWLIVVFWLFVLGVGLVDPIYLWEKISAAEIATDRAMALHELFQRLAQFAAVVLAFMLCCTLRTQPRLGQQRNMR